MRDIPVKDDKSLQDIQHETELTLIKISSIITCHALCAVSKQHNHS